VRRIVIVVMLLMLVGGGVARADTLGSIGLGSTTFLPSWNLGLWGGAALEFHGRWGARADGFLAQGGDVKIGEASAMYRLAAARPHLVIYGFFGAGVTAPRPAFTLDAGLSTQLKILKRGKFPIALELLIAGHLVTDRGPLSLVVTSVLGLDYAW
jgi:hypothetical protein